MALINDLYVFVKDEDVKRGIQLSDHPVESGLDVTDNVKRNPVTISITGEIVGENASKILSKITDLHQSGGLVNYIGRNVLNKGLITAFDTSHPNTIYGGCSFTMEIRELRIAKSPLEVKKVSTKKQLTLKVTSTPLGKKHTVKRGDTLWTISQMYYGSGNQYANIYNANKSIMKNTNDLRVGMVLTIPVMQSGKANAVAALM